MTVAHDPGGQRERGSRPEGGDQPGRHRGGRRMHGRQVVGKPEQHDPEQAGDGQLEPAVAALAKGQDGEGDESRQRPGDGQRHAEQQVEPDRRAHELGHVGDHRD